MNARFECEVCRYARPVPEDYAGQKVRCPQCAAVVAVGKDGAAHKACPFCAEQILAEARKCRWCGEVIDRDLAIAKEKERIREIERREQVLRRRLPGAVSSLICGFLAVLAAPVLGSFLSPVAILLAIQAIREHKRSPHLEGAKFAWAGLVLGVFGLVSFVLFMIFLRRFLPAASPSS